MKRFRNGQSTLEYVIILAAVIGAILLIAVSLSGKMKTSYKTLGTTMETKADDVSF